MLAPMLINFSVNYASRKHRALYSSKIPDFQKYKLIIGLL